MELFEAVRERMAQNRSRRSVSSNMKSEHPHLLTKLLRCHECGTELWSQTQSSEGKTYYKSPDRGLSVICCHQGRSFVGWRFEEQVERLFDGFRLREDWIDWIIEHHVKGQDHAAAVQKRHSIQTQVERARHLYLAGEIDWRSFTVAKNLAEAELVGTHIPEIDDATRAGAHLEKLASEWRPSSVSRRNRLLRTALEAIYVDLDQRAVVGLLPKPDYCTSMLAMADRHDVAIRPAVTGSLLGMVETGESRTPRPETSLTRCATSLFGVLISPLRTLADRIPWQPTDKNYGTRLSVSSVLHPRKYCTSASQSPGNPVANVAALSG